MFNSFATGALSKGTFHFWTHCIYFQGGCQNKIVILTGPNACGKSVYLKQVGLICYLAHLGCWVPAKTATIPIIDGIYTRIQTVDSVALGLSAFTVDLNQMSRALNNATGQSLGCVHLLNRPYLYY